MITAMILAGGVGSRVGADRPKQFVEVLEKPILAYTIELFQNMQEVDSIAVVCHKEWISYLTEMIEKYHLSKVEWIVPGGETFQKSVLNGVRFLEKKLALEDMVLVHYGAAPFTSKRIIQDAIQVCKEHRMSVSCTPCYQLMGTNDEDRTSCKWVDRDQYIQIASPQCFQMSYIKEIYDRAEQKNIIDTTEPHVTSLMYALGEVIYQSYGDQTNIKITTKEDIFLFEGYAMAKARQTEQEH